MEENQKNEIWELKMKIDDLIGESVEQFLKKLISMIIDFLAGDDLEF